MLRCRGAWWGRRWISEFLYIYCIRMWRLLGNWRAGGGGWSRHWLSTAVFQVLGVVRVCHARFMR